MTIEKAINELMVELGSPSWLVALGVGKIKGADCIYVYANRNLKPYESAFFAHGWKSFPIVLKKVGKLRPAIITA